MSESEANKAPATLADAAENYEGDKRHSDVHFAMYESAIQRAAELAAAPEGALVTGVEGVDYEPRPFSERLRAGGIGLIAEFKRQAPSSDREFFSGEVGPVIQAYERGGARAISVLTEPHLFGGSLDDLRAAREATELPILRKDFIVDSRQVVESRAAGADAILLIHEPDFLTLAKLAELNETARLAGLGVIIEVHGGKLLKAHQAERKAVTRADAREYDRESKRLLEAARAHLLACEQEIEDILELQPDMFGVNNRDLDSLVVDYEATHELLRLPAVVERRNALTVVAESGISDALQVEEMNHLGVDAVLVGEELMKANDPEARVRELLSETPEEPDVDDDSVDPADA